MTEKWRSLEYRIREAAYNAMKAKQEAAQVRLTTKVMEPEPEPEPEPEVIKEEIEEVEIEEANDYGKGKMMKHMDDSHGSHRIRMVHSVTAYDRQNLDRHQKKGSYYNHYALGHYLKAVDGAHDEMKKGTHPSEAINKHFNGPLAKRLHKHLGTGGTDIDTQRKAAFNENIEVVEAEPAQPDPMKDKMAQQKAQVQKQKGQLRMQIAQQRAAKQEQAMKAKGEKSLEKIKEEDELDEMQSVTNKGDHDVLKAFANKQTHQSKKLSTDGTTLHGNWMGGHSIAHWHEGKVRFRTASSRSEQAVHRALRKKHLPPNDIHEEALDERMQQRIRTFGRASKLQQLHSTQYSRLSSAGNHAKAEAHRKRAMEYKRIAYQAKDNPDKLPV